jgi:YHS domain-containing protein
MNKWIARAGATLALVSLTAGMALAGPPKDKGKDKGKKGMECPVCHMKLSEKKTKDNPTEVTIKGKKYYCCSKCDMKKKGGKKGTPKVEKGKMEKMEKKG